MVWPNFVAGGHQRLVCRKLLCGLNYRTVSNLNIFLWKTNIEETQNGRVRGSILFCYFPFILLLKHITIVLKKASIPMPVSNLQLDICGEIKRDHDREDEWACWTHTTTDEQWYPLPLMKESASFIDIAFLWLCVTCLERRLQYTAVYVATFI